MQKKQPPKEKPRIMRKIVNTIALFLGVLIFFLALIIGIVMYLNSPPGGTLSVQNIEGLRTESNNSLFLEVRKGESGRSVGARLEQAGIIRNRYFWDILSRVDGEFIKAGTYRLEIPVSQMAIYNILAGGKQLLQRVTIPEGVTLKKAAKILQENGICPEEEFLDAVSDPAILDRFHIPGKTMEGYLFPDTYLFPANYPAPMVIQAMADTFFDTILELDPRAQSLSPEELNRRVIIASIVEREYRVNEEAPLMAGVFYNRLSIGMALQSCATVEYIITEIQGRPHPDVLYTRDTEIRDPYNTYIRPGLPPGPISAPGAVALAAAFQPASSNYLYFRLVDPAAGRHYFSQTLDDHIKAGMLYVKGR
jgi:UPF0755 protein